MKCFALLAVVVGFAMSTHPTNAQEQLTRAQLLEECELAAKAGLGESQTTPESIKAVHCVGYMRGALDMLGLWDAANTLVPDRGRIPACVPDEVLMREVATVVVKYLNDHPNKMHEKYFVVVILALADAYPCKK